jgi:SAM-dependent methyltransferase
MAAPGGHDEERLRRRASFDTAAQLYDDARPGYPEVLFDDLVALAHVPAGGSVLEVGSGTGKATLPLARRGFQILGIELGANMAALARRKLAPYPNARIEVGDFETWPLPDETFDLAVSASAWHWIDPSVGYPKVARALKPTGSLAVVRASRGDSDGDGDGERAHDRDIFAEAMRAVQQQVAPEVFGAGEVRRRHWHAGRADQIAASGLFDPPVIRTYRLTINYDTTSYLRLLDPYQEKPAECPCLQAWG